MAEVFTDKPATGQQTATVAQRRSSATRGSGFTGIGAEFGSLHRD